MKITYEKQGYIGIFIINKKEDYVKIKIAN